MTQRPRILLITPGFAADEDDSTCIPAQQVFVKGLVTQWPQWEFEVLTLHYPFRTDPYMWFGLKVHPLNLPMGARIRRFFNLQAGIRWFKKHHAQHPYDAIHAFWLSDAAQLGSKMAHRYELPFLTTLMGQDALRANHYHRWLHLPQHQVVAVSQRAARAYGEVTGQSPQVIPWGLGPFEWPDHPPRTIDVLGVGSLIGLKAYEDFVETVALLKQNFPQIQAEILGEGPLLNQLKERVHRLGLAENCRLLGKVPRDQVLSKMRRAKILLHPSTYEGLGFVFVEALAAGMTLVSRPVGIAEAGPRWRLAHSPQEFATACGFFLENPPKAIPTWPYPLEGVYQAYAEIYQSWFKGGDETA